MKGSSYICVGDCCGPLIDYPRFGLWNLSLSPLRATAGPMAHTSCLCVSHNPALHIRQSFCAVNSTMCCIYERGWENFLSVFTESALSRSPHCWKHGVQIFIVIIFCHFKPKSSSLICKIVCFSLLVFCPQSLPATDTATLWPPHDVFLCGVRCTSKWNWLLT